MRALLLVVAACAVLVVVSPAAAAPRIVERGIVQSVGPSEVVLRALDGSELTVEVGPATRVRLNGRPTGLAALRAGFVAEAVTVGNGPARLLRAFGRVQGAAVVGELVQIHPRAVVLRRVTGVRVRIPLVRRTRVWRDGRVVPRRTLHPGMRVRVVRARHGAARVVLILEGRGV